MVTSREAFAIIWY